MKVSFLSLLAMAGMAQAIAWAGPKPTPVDAGLANAFQGFTPRPTDGPPLQHAMDLLKRDYEPNVCGYESGMEAWPVTCSPGRTCYFFTETSVWGMRGCCTAADYSNCGWAVDCVDQTDYSASCGLACQDDPLTLKCTANTAPYCQAFKYPDPGVVDYGCGTDIDLSIRTVALTYAGEAPASSLNFAHLSITNSFTPSADGLSVPATHTSPLGGSISTSSSHSSHSSSPTPAPVPQHKSTPIGAIVGGVVGGLAVIAAVVVAIVLCCLRSKRKSKEQMQVAPMQGPDSGPGMMPYQSPQQGAYQGVPVAAPQPYGQVQYYPPPDEKMQPYQVTTQPYYGEGMTPPMPPPVQSPAPSSQLHGISSEGGTLSSRPGSTSVPVSPLPTYNRGSMVSSGTHVSPPSDASQLHGESVAPAPAPTPSQATHLTNADGNTIYEAPGH